MSEKRPEMSGHTPGPWEWRYCVRGLPELVNPRHGMLLVMDAVRDGMQRATLRFARRTPSDVGGIMFKAADFFAAPAKRVPDMQVPANPDMRLIAAAPELLAERDRLRDLLREALEVLNLIDGLPHSAPDSATTLRARIREAIGEGK